MAKLTLTDRALAIQLGWQAECAVQDHAAHLAHSFAGVSRGGASFMPTNLADCIEIGRRMLRAHLETVQADADVAATLNAVGAGCPLSGGWAIFNECEIQQDDEAKLFAHDDEAKEHIAGCDVCRAMLTIEAGNLGLDVENMLKPEAQS